MNTYKILKKVHLYASLSIIVLLLMYVFSSYLMIHSNWFNTYENIDQTVVIDVHPTDVNEDNWNKFLKENSISGRQTKEQTTGSGDIVREYSSAGGQFKVTLFQGREQVEIVARKKNVAGTIVGFHRIRGYQGPWFYHVYAVMLDLVGLSLILFAITGAILWLNLLKSDVIAWVVFIGGLVYVTAIISYLATV